MATESFDQVRARAIKLEGSSFDNPNAVRYNSGEDFMSGGRIPQMELQTIRAYGHSYVFGDGSGIAGGKYISRVHARVGSATLTINALNGTGVESATQRAFGTTGDTFAAGTKAVVYLDHLVNTFLFNGYNNVANKAAIIGPTRAFMAVVSASQRYDSSGSTVSGAWSNSASAIWTGGGIRLTSTPGDYIEQVVAVTAAGKVDVDLTANVTGFGAPSAPFKISVDGIDTLFDAGGDGLHVFNAATENVVITHRVVTLSGLTPGNRTIRVTMLPGGKPASVLYVDSFLPRSATPPPIIIMMQPTLPYAATFASYPAYGRAGVESERLQMEIDLKALIAAEFPNGITVDVDDGWNFGMLGSDNLHKNDYGQAYLANQVETAMRKIPFSIGFMTSV